MSKKRKKPGQQRGGRYTPPGGGPARRPRGGALGSGLGFEPVIGDNPSFDALLDDGEDDQDDDGRWPVTIALPTYGSWTVPHAFASWIEDDGRLADFDQFMSDRRTQGIRGDALETFVAGRDDVPEPVRQAVANYDQYIDDHFGPPVS